jgi:hypothetical protein
VALHWEYNVTRKRWETSASGWRAIVARWANGTEWMAALESLNDRDLQYVAEHIFS